MSAESKRILGIDPGSRLCGWGLVSCQGSKIQHVDNGVFVLTGVEALPERLALLMQELEDVLERYRPDAVAVEGVFQHRNARSALILGQARGVALATCSVRGLTVTEYSPLQVKKSVTGTGRANKAQIQQMIALRLGLKSVPQEDAADAVAVAICHAQMLHAPQIPAIKAKKKSKRTRDAALLALARERGIKAK